MVDDITTDPEKKKTPKEMNMAKGKRNGGIMT